MAPPLCRLYSTISITTPTTSAASIATSFLSKWQTQPPQQQTQLMDGNQLQRLSCTLGRTELSATVPRPGTLLPACYHLGYFTPAQLESELALDGTDRMFNPAKPYTRRMWAGGEVEWVAAQGKGLRVGEEVVETTRLVSAVGKRTRIGEEMVVVGVEKSFENQHGVAVVDKRNWIFRAEITTPQTPAAKPTEVPLPEGKYVRDFTQSPVTLFRFSALTFNGHKIHYNREWCREVEGHRDVVVHGPLNLVNMLDFWRDVKGLDAFPRRITYRATSPLYGGEKYRIVMEEERHGVMNVRIVDSYGKVAMVGQIESV